MMLSLLALNDDSLLHILRKAATDDPLGVVDVLLVCKRFRNLLLAAASSVRIRHDNAALLRHCLALRSMTLEGCSHLPWAMDTHDGVPCCSPTHLSHLSSLTRLDARDAALPEAETSKLVCLPGLRQLRASKELSDAGLAQLAGMVSLRHLDLSDCKRLTASSLMQLSKFTVLESLDIRRCSWSANECMAHVTGLTALTKFEFEPGFGNFLDITDEGLSRLACLTGLRSVNLESAYELTAAGLKHLSALRCLESLELSDNEELSHEDLAPLSSLRSLQRLSLSNCEGVDINKGLAHVAGLTGLQDLWFDHEGLNDEGMQHLTHLTALTHLNLQRHAHMTEAGFHSLRSLSSLRLIILRDLPPSSFSAIIPHLTSHQHLHKVYTDDVSDEAFVQLCTLGTLTQLRLSGKEAEGEHDLAQQTPDGRCSRLGDHGLAQVSKLRQLQYLDLERCELLTGRGLARLTELVCLTRLCLRHCSAICELTLPSSLRSVDLLGCHSINDFSLTALHGLQALNSLRLSKCYRLTDAGLAHLRKLTTLEILFLSWCRYVTDTGMEQLSNLRALTFLEMDGCIRVRDEGLVKLLAHLPRLRSLSLFGVPLTCDGLGHVARSSSLKYLGLKDCPHITSESLVQLTSLAQLEWLAVSRPMVPDAQVQLQCMKGLSVWCYMW